MSELTELLKIYSYMFEQTEMSNEFYLEEVPDENLTLAFLDEIKDRSKDNQSFFIRALIKFRPECRDRLIELSSDEDEDVQVQANAGLMYTDQRHVAMQFFKTKIFDRLKNDELNEGNWPIHFLMDYLLETPAEDNMQFSREMLSEILQMENINPVQIDWIKRYIP